MRPEFSKRALASEFEQELVAKAIVNARLSTITATISFGIFALLDYLVYRELLATFLLIRGGLIFSLFIINLLTRVKFGQRHILGLGMAEYLICTLSIVLMINLTGDSSSPYYAGIVAIFVSFAALMPLTLIRTIIVSVIVYIAYLLPPVVLGRVNNPPVFIMNNFFFVATVVLMNISAYLADQMRFREFSGRYNLAQANEELKKLDVLKSQFFANVSHEVRTPLTSILAPVQSLYQGDIGPMEPEHQRLIGQVYVNSLKLLDMINQMLDFSKFEAGKMQLRLRYTDLDELVRDIASTFQDVIERKGLKLHYVRDGEVPPIYLDSDKLERILSNFIRNAIKFTETGSITLRIGSAIGKVWLEVRDTGIGIPQQHLPNIFKRFQQVDGSSTRRYEGTGLGLTIVKEAVELMRGTVSVHSEEGRGSTFRVEIPSNLEQLVQDAFIERRRIPERRMMSFDFEGNERRLNARRLSDVAKISLDDLALIEREQMNLQDKEKESLPAGASLVSARDRVLLIEDNADLRSYISRMLTRFGHEVSTAVDGLDGWVHVQNHMPDIVISDIMMPRMDGFELLQKIKATETTSKIPVILITAKSELESKLEGLEIGADDYLPKPINMRELDARIKNLVKERSLQQSLARQAQLEKSLDDLSRSFSEALELRDSYTAGHSKQVLQLGCMIAENAGMQIDWKFKQSLLMHDIGKLKIPDAILRKETPLDEEEWAIIRKHPEYGADYLAGFESYKEISPIILAHQEHYDGSGYPNGLVGEQIPEIARVIAIADAYHAMTSYRTYRKAMQPAAAAQELIRYRGTQFDPKLVDAFIKGLIDQKWIQPGDLQLRTGTI
jgi:response regulator RpfG family c-di-GMP phosphodiesterase/signal transduction histidine kinase